jgi:hypothetical protein
VNAKHSNVTHRWGTPSDIVERGRRAMGRITLDPCSEEKFNQTVKADRYYSFTERGEDGLLLPWSGCVFLNPPSEEKGKPRQNFVRRFWEKMLSEPIEQCVYVGFTMEHLGLLADATAHPSDFSICYMRTRIPFVRHDRAPGERDAPAHANFICGFGVNHAAFLREFGELGKVQAGPMAVL